MRQFIIFFFLFFVVTTAYSEMTCGQLGQQQIATTETTVYTVPASTTALVDKVRIANVTSTEVDMALYEYTSGGSFQYATETYPITVPPTDFTQIEGTYLQAGAKITGKADTASAVTVTVNGCTW